MNASKEPQPHIRHHRQQLIPGWRQEKLALAQVGIVGDGPYPASFFLAAASALGMRRFLIICPELHPAFVNVAQALEPTLEWVHLRGWLTHSAPAALLTTPSVLVDFSQLGLTNKILFNTARAHSIPLVTVRCTTDPSKSGFRFWSYTPGKESAIIHAMVSERSLSAVDWQDAATAMAAAGLALEEVKRVLFGQPQTFAPVEYVRPNPRASLENLRVAVVGAGALGNFAASTLTLCGCRYLTLFDPDRVDVTNLNRQIFFAHDIGSSLKAPALAHRLNTFFGAHAQGVAQSVDERTDLSPFDVVLDCVDNFETRRLLSLRAQQEGKILISGGTGPDKGQVVAYHPHRSRHTPAQLLDLDGILSKRQRNGRTVRTRERLVPKKTRQRGPPSDTPLEETFTASASCLVQADPSVVMSNQIIGAFMADVLRRMLSGEPSVLIFYESREPHGVRLMTVDDTNR